MATSNANVPNPNDPVVKNNIVFVDSLAQAAGSLNAKAEYTQINGFGQADKLMLFGLEDWTKDDELKTFTKSFEKNDFEKLELFGCELKESGTKALAEGLLKTGEDVKKFKEIDLDHSPISKEAADFLFDSITKGQTVEQLNLQGSIPDKETFCHMLQKLADNQTLKTLILKINKIEGAWLKDDMQAYLANAQLLELDLFYNNIGEDGCEFICYGLEDPRCQLQSLNLCCNEIKDKGACFLARAMLSNKSLRELDISLNNIGDDGITAICQSVHRESWIYYEEGTDTSDPLIQRIHRQLRMMKLEFSRELKDFNKDCVLESLNISANNFGDDGLHHVSELLTKRADLKFIDFTGIEAGERGWLAFLDALTMTGGAEFKDQEVHFSIVDVVDDKMYEVDDACCQHTRFHYKRRKDGTNLPPLRELQKKQ